MKDRKKNRLEAFHYNSWYFFVTINVKNHAKIFGEVVGEGMVLNKYWKIVEECILDLPNHYINCNIWDFIIMPNHIHLIVIIDNVGDGLKSSLTNKEVGEWLKSSLTNKEKKLYGLSEVIRWLKTFSSRKINQSHNDYKFQRQRSFYDHIIRNENDMNRVIEYIELNPYKRENDEYYMW